MAQIIAREVHEVNPAVIEAALLDAWLADMAESDCLESAVGLALYEAEATEAFDHWMDANANRLADEYEADSATESGAWAW